MLWSEGCIVEERRENNTIILVSHMATGGINNILSTSLIISVLTNTSFKSSPASTSSRIVKVSSSLPVLVKI